MIEPPEQPLHLLELLLCLRNRHLEAGQTHLVVDLVLGPRLVLVGSKVLNLLARVLDFCQAQRGRRTLEEMAQRGELGEVFIHAGWRGESQSRFCGLVVMGKKDGRGEKGNDDDMRNTYRLASIFKNVLSACWKKS